MSVQTKILLLLLAIVATLVGGLVAFKVSEERKFQAIAAARAVERNRNFDDFLAERGDNLKVLVEDTSIWNDMVLAIGKNDFAWAEQNINDQMLATYTTNAIWIYKPDQTLFYSRNNRYAENLRELPVPREALAKLFAGERVCHFFLQVPQGWMEIRGGTIHPTIDRLRETKPQGYFFAGHIWIDDNVRRMTLFTGLNVHIVPLAANEPAQPSAEESGLITFSRDLPGWAGPPVARIIVQNDSPIIRELNRASQRLFHWLLLFALGLFFVLSLSLVVWIRRPLHLLTRGLQTGDPEMLAPLRSMRNEFGQLAELILKFRRTEDALHDAEERLRHAQKLEAVGRLAGGIAHDFNNLLTAIIGFSELLEARLTSGDENHDFAKLIRQAGEKAAGLTKQLLAFSRRQFLMPKVLDLNDLILELEKLLQRVIGEHIRIRIETKAVDARVRADAGQLEQVILNLGVNARDAMPQGGTLTISTGNHATVDVTFENGEPPSAGYIYLTVADTGCGMDRQTKERIFEPFFTTKGVGKGTGLGLATAYGIVKQSGGGIHVESELGKGSQFVIYFPRETGPIEAVEPAPPPALPASKAETVLVVEDEDVVRQLICTVLSDSGYQVLCTGSPTEALRLAREHATHIELLVTDVVMPETHGPALAREIAALRPDVKVLFVSGYSENDISDQGVLDPNLDVLQKPFTKLALMQKIRAVLDCENAGPLD